MVVVVVVVFVVVAVVPAAAPLITYLCINGVRCGSLLMARESRTSIAVEDFTPNVLVKVMKSVGRSRTFFKSVR